MISDSKSFEQAQIDDKNSQFFSVEVMTSTLYGDIKIECSDHRTVFAHRVYIASRQGENWLASRKGLLGLPHDFWTETRFFHWLFTVLPRLHMNLLEFLTDLRFDRETVTGCANKQLIANKSQLDSILTEEVEQYQLSPPHQLITEIKSKVQNQSHPDW
uniref:BTB domain-containing protein n=1 Tax=Romanomermis culicivorax TaxID=13658 RepID=A0A915KNZ8_ROMCU